MTCLKIWQQNENSGPKLQAQLKKLYFEHCVYFYHFSSPLYFQNNSIQNLYLLKKVHPGPILICI